MEQRPAQSTHDRNTRSRALVVSLAAIDFLAQIAATAGAHSAVVLIGNSIRPRLAGTTVLDVLCTLTLKFLLILAVLSCIRRTILASNLRHAEDRFPSLKRLSANLTRWSREAETGGGESAFGPAVVDAGEMPVYFVRGSVAVELIADVDEVLDGGYIDVVDGGEVKDYCF